MTAPTTTTGKVLLVFYGLMGCSATILFFNLFLERVITLLSLMLSWGQTTRLSQGELQDRTDEGNRSEEWKPSVYHVTLILFITVLVVACGAASVYSAMEGWTYLESLYFCFVAFSTVGFGDFVSGQRKHHEDIQVYQVANCLLMLLGVCCTYSLFNTMSMIIKQGLVLILRALDSVYNHLRNYGVQFRPLLKLCFSDSEPAISRDDDTHRGRQMQEASSSSRIKVKSKSKCLCADAKLETVCHRNQ